MSQKMWEANSKIKSKSNFFAFEKFLAKNFNYKPEKNYKKLFNWTIRNPKHFWSSMWEFSNIKGVKNYKFHFPKEIIKSKFLVNSKLNYAENLLFLIPFIFENSHIEDQKSFGFLIVQLNNFLKFFSGL